VNNVSDNQIVANSLTVLDKSPQSTTSVDDGQNENPQFSSAYDKNNDYICLHELLSGFPDYLTYSLLLVLISCGAYQMVISVLKMVVLSVCGIAYVVIVHLINNGFIFDQQDFLLQQIRKMSDHHVATKYLLIAIILVFIVAISRYFVAT
jgi:hypothetical protein